ncbi:MAG TPA: alpha/beta hydrolase [Thermoanaerobaculia bacterium]|jgi:hypothetical protein|nr:alpha/beta hydrolase [Thermoanaerobaculia bacterium]
MVEIREKSANQIHMYERDYFLRVHDRNWPSPSLNILDSDLVFPQAAYAGKSWRAGVWQRVPAEGNAGGVLWRVLRLGQAEAQQEMFETILRFPTAPLFGPQRKRDYQFRLNPVHQHTFRLLTPFSPTEPQSATRIFLLFNGINEIDHLGFYHTLSRLVMAQDSPTACLICPFPGHLTRYPLHGRYAEKPIQRFISDPSDLFRQYLRYMIEIQWVLSVLVPVSSYPVTPGQPLLAESMNPGEGRCNSIVLGEEIAKAWRTMYASSKQSRRETSAEPEEVCTTQDAIQAVTALRNAIGWKHCEKRLEDLEEGSLLPPPRLHVVGYSLGGYLAQSAFFTWPFALGTCTALCSGGALQDLRPVKIAHEEEWRSITHGLTFEVDCAMLEGRIRLEESDNICGIPASDFGSHYRIFHDVFLQDPYGSYRARVSEFAPRLFFVVGGNDPIVPTNSLIQASPKGGINLIEIANLTHFIATDAGEWSDFWLPMVTQVIVRLSERMEVSVSKSMLASLWNQDTTGPAGTWGDPEKDRGSVGRSEPDTLSMKMLQDELDKLVETTRAGGFLFVLRNNLPVILMGRRRLHHRGVMPHFEDLSIRYAWEKVQEQCQTLKMRSNRITLVLPGRLNEWFRRKPSVISSKSRALAREASGQGALEAMWQDFLDDWECEEKALWRFDPHAQSPIHSLEQSVREETSTPSSPMHPILNCLPDVWIGFSTDVLGRTMASEMTRTEVHRQILDLACLLFEFQRKSVPASELAERKALQLGEWLRTGALRIVRISSANATPNFMGERITDPESAIDLIVHSALALLYSTPCDQVGDFARDWQIGDLSPSPTERPKQPT